MHTLKRWGWMAPLVSLMVAASAQQTITYTVKKGDSLYTIARRHGLRVPDLLRVNKLRNPHALQIGDKIKIPLKRASLQGRSSIRSNASAAGWAVLNRDRVNVRVAPRLSAARITLVDRWTKVRILARQGEWSRVQLPNGRAGWIKSEYLSPTKPPREKQVAKSSRVSLKRVSRKPSRLQTLAALKSRGLPEAVRSALAYLGSRYRYGGSSARGFDCSGFTMHVFRKHGIVLPHSSRAQFRVGVPVARHELRPGDLVFFRTRGRGVSHVGIYIGDGKFIHASSARGRVRIDTLNSGYYKKRYVGARRILKR